MLTINFHPFPNLETERLFLRRLTEDDINDILALRGNFGKRICTRKILGYRNLLFIKKKF